MSKFHSKKDSTAAQGKKSVALLTCLLLYLLVTQAALEGSFFYGRFLSYLLGSFAYKQHHQWHSAVMIIFHDTLYFFRDGGTKFLRARASSSSSSSSSWLLPQTEKWQFSSTHRHTTTEAARAPSFTYNIQ